MGRDSSTRLRAVTAFLAISAGLVSYTCLEFMLEALRDDFSMSSDETMVVADIASGASLLVVFLVGALADRWGDRRALSTASVTFCAGALLIGIAPNAGVLLVGQSLSGIGTIAMSIVGLSILNKTFPAKEQRARAFGVFAVIAPTVAVVLPLVASGIVATADWRWVTTTWLLLGIATLLLARRSLASRSEHTDRAELATPGLAGTALAGIALAISFVKINSRTSSHTLHAVVSASIGVLALAVLVAAMRRLARPTLDLRTLRSPGSYPIAMALFVVNGVNLFFFTFAVLQFRYHQSLLETAAMLIVPQVTSACGAILGGRLSARHGSTRVATAALLAAAAFSVGVFVVAAESSAWVPVTVLAIAGLPIGAVVGPLTQTFMDLAPAGGAGAASSLRNSAVNLGIAIGGLIVGTIVFDDLDRDTARNIGAYREQVHAFHLAGVFCFVAYALAAALVMIHSRRRRVGAVSLAAG